MSRTDAKRQNLWINLLLAFNVFILLPVTLELGARVLLPAPPRNAMSGLAPCEVEDDRLLWRNRAGYGEDPLFGPINSHGFRGPEFSMEKGAGIFRVLSLGESTTFGSGLQWDETYSHLLNEELAKRERPAQVINGGVGAWSSLQSTRLLSMEMDRLLPDLVLFYHEINDFLPTTYRGLSLPGAGMTDSEAIGALDRRRWMLRLVGRSRFLTHLRLAWIRKRATASLHTLAQQHETDVLGLVALPYAALPASELGSQPPWMANENRLVRLPDADRERTLRELVALTRQHEVELVFLHPSYPESKPHRCVLTRVAEQQRIPVFEMEQELYRDAVDTGRRKPDYFRPNDRFHPNALGHRVIAERLADFLAERDLVPKRSP